MFKKFASWHGGSLERNWGDGVETAMMDWRVDLADLTVMQVATGMDASRDYKYIPSLPEFRRMCRPPLDLESLFNEAQVMLQRRRDNKPEQWSDPVAFWAACKFPFAEFVSASYTVMAARWRHAVTELSKTELLPIPEIVRYAPAIEAPISRGNVELIEAMRNLFTQEKKGSRAWAYKILDRIKAKDRSVCASAEESAIKAVVESRGEAAFTSYMRA